MTASGKSCRSAAGRSMTRSSRRLEFRCIGLRRLRPQPGHPPSLGEWLLSVKAVTPTGKRRSTGANDRSGRYRMLTKIEAMTGIAGEAAVD
ncbi:hypothetical protein R5H32_20890, partial [Defluviimonas sp. D31]|uniref:hypothetical protein n=1 Tax=Defluviimonas sp. D31 TaxID=3083253 RepID=UPI00296EE336